MFSFILIEELIKFQYKYWTLQKLDILVSKNGKKSVPKPLFPPARFESGRPHTPALSSVSIGL